MRHTIKSTLAALVLSVSLSAPVAAGPFEDGAAAYEKGDYATALRLWRPLAEQGHAKAQLILGDVYRDGRGVKQNFAQAVKWYRKAAEQGDAAAQIQLGVMYAFGWGVKQDDAEAMRWFRQAAEQGFTAARYNLGVMYDKGRGVKQEPNGIVPELPA